MLVFVRKGGKKQTVEMLRSVCVELQNDATFHRVKHGNGEPRRGRCRCIEAYVVECAEMHLMAHGVVKGRTAVIVVAHFVCTCCGSIAIDCFHQDLAPVIILQIGVFNLWLFCWVKRASQTIGQCIVVGIKQQRQYIVQIERVVLFDAVFVVHSVFDLGFQCLDFIRLFQQTLSSLVRYIEHRRTDGIHLIVDQFRFERTVFRLELPVVCPIIEHLAKLVVIRLLHSLLCFIHVLMHTEHVAHKFVICTTCFASDLEQPFLFRLQVFFHGN
mmetsp:Transcript_31219/g.50187  ORF Transcript_31219/g.50187 Transcript_31219/m.50187 type:complete len:271 (-) Transcript_31219:1029-1841(-)